MPMPSTVPPLYTPSFQDEGSRWQRRNSTARTLLYAAWEHSDLLFFFLTRPPGGINSLLLETLMHSPYSLLMRRKPVWALTWRLKHALNFGVNDSTTSSLSLQWDCYSTGNQHQANATPLLLTSRLGGNGKVLAADAQTANLALAFLRAFWVALANFWWLYKTDLSQRG